MSDNWVVGPSPVDGRFDVFEGTVAVLLHNGEAYDVRGPGRHGGLWRVFSENRLPVLGSTTMLTFDRVPPVSDPVTTDVRLRDGATVKATVQATVTAAWEDRPKAALDIVRRYGTNPRRIQEGAQRDLDDSLRVMMVESLQKLSHNEVHQASDHRSLMRVPAPRGPLRVDRILSCVVTRDPHEEQFVTTTRNADIARLRAGIDAEMDRLRAESQNQIAAIRQQGDLKRRAIEAHAQAELDKATAQLLGIDLIDVRHPDQRTARLAAQYDLVRSIFADNLDLLPLLADPSHTRVLAGLFHSIGMSPAPQQAQVEAPANDRRLEAPTGAQPGVRVLRRAVAQGPCGQQEALLVEPGEDRVVGAIGTSGPHRLLVSISDDPVDVALRALRSAADWSGTRITVRVRCRAGNDRPGQVAVTSVDDGGSDPNLVASVLGPWVLAINAMLGGAAKVVIDE